MGFNMRKWIFLKKNDGVKPPLSRPFINQQGPGPYNLNKKSP